MRKSNRDDFFDYHNRIYLALTYKDIRARTGYAGAPPSQVSLESRFSRNVPLKVPIVSAAMDTVTESAMAIAMAKCGGLGVIHRAMLPKKQAAEVKRVKLHLNGLIENPVCVSPDQTIGQVLETAEKNHYTFQTFPVTNQSGKVLGLLTSTDLDKCEKNSSLVKDIMTPVSKLQMDKPGTPLDKAYKKLREIDKKVLLLVGPKGILAGMYIWSDVKRLVTRSSELFNIDAKGQLRVGAAVGAGDHEVERAKLLWEAGADVIVIDTAHADTYDVFRTIEDLKRSTPKMEIVAGNISEAESAERLARLNIVDGLKVGQGGGSICTTRKETGIGCPQATAIYNCTKAVRGCDIPVCADGGIVSAGDISLALAIGASSVMLGFLLAGTTETPGEIISGKHGRRKHYDGMGSERAMRASRASRERYRQSEFEKIAPEGVESKVPIKGSVEDEVSRMAEYLRRSLGYNGVKSIEELRQEACFWRITHAGLIESDVHDVLVDQTEGQ